MKLREIVNFREDLLFDGAVQVDWFDQDPEQSEFAAQHFVFHGPDYHGVQQSDLGHQVDHKLIDTASFAAEIAAGFATPETRKAFRIAIAGYGTGKSHLALTLAHLLDNPTGDSSQKIVTNIADASTRAGARISDAERDRPHLVAVINGMADFDLAGEITRQVVARLNSHGLDAEPVEELRPRFKVAERLLDSEFFGTIEDELAETLPNMDKAGILDRLRGRDEAVFAEVSKVLDAHDMSVSNFGRTSLQDLIGTVCERYCGPGKPFLGFTILFDEFGRYLEFATQRSHVAGAGAVQQLFEGVQANADTCSFVGFIQYELNAYVQRVAPEYQNEILRFVTRFQTASRHYLSVNLETLIAHFLQKSSNGAMQTLLSRIRKGAEEDDIQVGLSRWFRNTANHAVWADPERFAKVVVEGCWPLHPAATWLLYHLASSGRHLQQRSALSLLRDAFARHQDSDDGWGEGRAIPAVGLWSEDLEEEFTRAEDVGTQIPITHAYLRILDRYRQHLDDDDLSVLRTIVLAAKLGVNSDSRDDAQAALVMLCGIPEDIVQDSVEKLGSEQLNVLEWDETARRFELVGDSASRPAFLAWLRQRSGMFDPLRRSELFRTKAQTWCDELVDVDPDFGSTHEVTTAEWRFSARCTDGASLEAHILLAVDSWLKANDVDAARGQLLHCYVPPESAIEEVMASARQQMHRALRGAGVRHAPILLVFLHDEQGTLGQAMAEAAILEEGLSPEEQNRFGNFPTAHRSRAIETIQTEVNRLIRKRHYVSAGPSDSPDGRLRPVLSTLLEETYPQLLPFPFDGFSTTRGNAATDCIQIARQLYAGDYARAWYTAQAPSLKNRADRVLCQSWGVEGADGHVTRRPANATVASLIRSLDGQLSAKNTVDLHEFATSVLCPPYGGNVASLMLLLGVYVCPRHSQLVFEDDSGQMAPDAWLTQSLGTRRSLSLERFSGVKLTRLSTEVSEEWELLLADWQNAGTYIARIGFAKQAAELEGRAKLPPHLFHQYKYLREQAANSQIALNALDSEENDALERLENAYERRNVSVLAWAGSDLLRLRERLANEGDAWTPEQIVELDPHIQRSTQACIQFFEQWLPRQTPRSTDPADAGKFQHKLDVVRRNLSSLGLQEQATTLEKHITRVFRDIEKAAEAHQLVIEVDNWCGEVLALSPLTRMAEINGQSKALRDLRDRVNALRRSVELDALDAARDRIQEAGKHIEDLQKRNAKRFDALDRMSLTSDAELDTAQAEVQSLLAVFEGCDSEIEDLLIMRRILALFASDYALLADMTVQDDAFKEKLSELSLQREASWDEDEEQPWDIPATYIAFGKTIGKLRKANADAWISATLVPPDAVDALDTADANRLLEKLRAAPPTLSATQGRQVTSLSRAIERHLTSREMEWLLERFKQLPAASQKKFLDAADQLARKS